MSPIGNGTIFDVLTRSNKRPPPVLVVISALCYYITAQYCLATGVDFVSYYQYRLGVKLGH